MDFKAICNGIAARYQAGTITTPAGAVAMKKAYGQMPASMPNVPAVVVIPQDGDVVIGSGTWDVTHHIDVNFYLSKAPGDPERVEAQRQTWLPTLLQAPLGAMQLGLAGTVKSAFPVSYEWAELPYGADLYDGITIRLDVIVRENVTLTP